MQHTWDRPSTLSFLRSAGDAQSLSKQGRSTAGSVACSSCKLGMHTVVAACSIFLSSYGQNYRYQYSVDLKITSIRVWTLHVLPVHWVAEMFIFRKFAFMIWRMLTISSQWINALFASRSKIFHSRFLSILYEKLWLQTTSIHWPSTSHSFMAIWQRYWEEYIEFAAIGKFLLHPIKCG